MTFSHSVSSARKSVGRQAQLSIVLIVASASLFAPTACGGSDDDDDDAPTAGAGGAGTSGGTGGTGKGGTSGGMGGGAGTTSGAGGTAGATAAGGSPGAAGDAASAGAAGAGGSIDLPCLGEAFPTTADDPVTFSGMVANGTTLVAGATVELSPIGGAALDTDTSSGTGAFALSVATGGDPLPYVLHSSAMDYWDTYAFPPRPLVADVSNAPIPMYTPANVSAAAALVSETQQGGNGVLLIRVLDCDDQPIAGATISTDSGETVYYTVNLLPTTSATTTSADGIAILFNVPPGDVVVDAAIGGTSLREHTVEVFADSATVTTVIP